MLIKLGSVTIESEKLGFPATVTPTEEQVANKIALLASEVAHWREKAEAALTREARYKADRQKLAEMECAMVLDEAERTFKISPAERPFFSDMWKTNPTAVKEHLDKLRAREFLRKEHALGDEAEPVALDPFTELQLAVADLRAGNGKLTEPEAVQIAYKKDPELFNRVTEARRQRVIASAPSGGRR